MYRSLISKLQKWMDSPSRKPLILEGAQQVGKTQLLQEFGKSYFKSVAYVLVEKHLASLQKTLDEGINVDRLLLDFQLITNIAIVPGETLIIIDEIQVEPRLLTALKYFCEEKPELHIAAAGSLLGRTIHEGTGYPVGKVDLLSLYPMTFYEFLRANNETITAQYLLDGSLEILESHSDKLERLLKEYYLIGGMPEVVEKYIQSHNFEACRQLQETLVSNFINTSSKHLNPADSLRAVDLFENIPIFLSHENKRVVYSELPRSSRGRDYKNPLSALIHTGIAYKVPRLKDIGLPLRAYADAAYYKLFVFDIGLYCALADIPFEVILKGNHLFTHNKGALVKQFVCQELIAQGITPFYWTNQKRTSEIDFMISHNSKLYAIEVEAEKNVHAKSLRQFSEQHPEVNARRFSLLALKDQEWMKNVPLWAIGTPSVWLQHFWV